jgi:ABC-type glycerol-3-phosphate transport system permease component
MKRVLLLLYLILIAIVVLSVIVIPIISLIFASFMNNASLSNGIGSISYVTQNILSLDEVGNRIVSISKDVELIKLFFRSFSLSLIVAFIVSWLSWVTSYYITRKCNAFSSYSLPLSLFTYLTPPVILVLGLSSIWNQHSAEFIWLKMLFSHSVFLFPIGFVLSFGFWVQKPYEIDRMAAADGASFWERLLLHLGIKEFLYMSIIGTLIFMISWSDIIFSRVLASSDMDKKQLVDYIFHKLLSNSVIDEYGALALFSLLIVFVSVIISIIFGQAFYRAIIENKE